MRRPAGAALLSTVCRRIMIRLGGAAVRARSMDAYRLFIYSDDGQLIGPAKIIHAANDTEAIAQAEVVRGSLAAELLDIEGLRIVKYLPGNGGAPAPKAAE